LLFKTSIKDLCKKKGVEHYFFDKIDSNLIEFLEKIKPTWIISSTSTLLTSSFINSSKHGVLNLHEAPLPEYKGSASYFWFILNNEKHAHVTAHYVVEELDAGDIMFEGPKISVTDKKSVFDLWKAMLFSYNDIWDAIIPYLKDGKKIPARKQIPNKIKTYPYPARVATIQLKQRGIVFFELTDFFFILKTAMRGVPD